MPTSDEDLQKQRDEVQKLRDQLAAEEAKGSERTQSLNNDITAQQLAAEKVRLETQLAAAKDANRASSVKSGAGAPLASAKEQMELAVAQQKSAEALRAADAKALEGAKAQAKDDLAQSTGDAVVAKSAATEGAPDAERRN